MTDLDHMEWAAQLLHSFDCGCENYGEELDGDEDLYYYAMAQIIDPVFAALSRQATRQGREEAARRLGILEGGAVWGLMTNDQESQTDDH